MDAALGPCSREDRYQTRTASRQSLPPELAYMELMMEALQSCETTNRVQGIPG